MKKFVFLFLFFISSVYGDIYNISNIINSVIIAPITNNVSITNDIFATNITVNSTNSFEIQNTVTNQIGVVNITNVFNNYVTNITQMVTGMVQGITNIILQPINFSTNYIEYSNSVDGRIGYITYVVTNGGSGGGASTSKFNFITTTTNYEGQYWDFIFADTTLSSITVTLPYASAITSGPFIVKKAASDNLLLINSKAGDTVEGTSQIGLSILNNSVELISDGVTNWWIR